MGKLLLGKLVDGETAVGEISGWEIAVGKILSLLNEWNYQIFFSKTEVKSISRQIFENNPPLPNKKVPFLWFEKNKHLYIADTYFKDKNFGLDLKRVNFKTCATLRVCKIICFSSKNSWNINT